MKKIKENKGITLVALVVTIIVLLILAGITILEITKSGLFEKSILAKEKSENESIKQEQTLNEYEEELDKYINGGTRAETGFPNYSAKIDIMEYSSKENQYTTTSNGYIVIPSFATANLSSVYIYIDDEKASFICNSANNWYRDSLYIPVSANSRIYYKLSGYVILDHGVYFVPNN